jgi:hypothetical protein
MFMKKSFVFGMASIVLSCVLLVTGCPKETDNPPQVWGGSATVGSVTITGKVDEVLTAKTVTITLGGGATFVELALGADAEWITNAPGGVTQKVKAKVNEGDTSARITVSGIPADEIADPLEITIPADVLSGGLAVVVTKNTAAKWVIAEGDPGAWVGNITIAGTTGTGAAITGGPKTVTITLKHGAKFAAKPTSAPMTWIQNAPTGVTQTLQTALTVTSTTAKINVNGTPSAISTDPLVIEIPDTDLSHDDAVNIIVKPNPQAKWNIN